MKETTDEVPCKKIKLNDCLETNENADVLNLFGLDVASKLRNISETERAEAINLINNIFANRLFLSNKSVTSSDQTVVDDTVVCLSENETSVKKVGALITNEDDVEYVSETDPLQLRSQIRTNNNNNNNSDRDCPSNSHDRISRVKDEIDDIILTNNSNEKLYVSRVKDETDSESSADNKDSSKSDDMFFYSEYGENDALAPMSSSEVVTVFADHHSAVNDVYDANTNLRAYSNVGPSENRLVNYSANNAYRGEVDSDADELVPSSSSSISYALDSDVEDVCIAYLLLRYVRNRRKKRKYWVLPKNRDRIADSHFETLFTDLRSDEHKFYEYYRMSVKAFDELILHIGKYIKKNNTLMRTAISVEERLAVTLRYLASGHSLKSISAEFRIGSSTISIIVKDVLEACWSVLKKTYMTVPSEQRWLKIANAFERNTGFVNCLGAMNVKLIKVNGVKKSEDGKFYVLHVVVDDRCNFVHVEIVDYERCNNFATDLTFVKQLLHRQLNLPSDGSSVVDRQSRQIVLPYVFLANKSLPLHTNIMKTFPMKRGQQQTFTPAELSFNRKFEQAFKPADDVFDLMFDRWNILKYGTLVKIPSAALVLKALCMLHNFIRHVDGHCYEFKNGMSKSRLCDMLNISKASSRDCRSSYAIRNQFADYFEGKNDANEHDNNSSI